jgi:hypothetical protein
MSLEPRMIDPTEVSSEGKERTNGKFDVVRVCTMNESIEKLIDLMKNPWFMARINQFYRREVLELVAMHVDEASRREVEGKIGLLSEASEIMRCVRSYRA